MSTSLVGSGLQFGGVVPTDPVVVGLLLVTLVVAVGIYRHRPPVPQAAVWAWVPWIVAGSTLQILATRVQYPPYLRPLFETSWVYLATVGIAGLVWIAILAGSHSRRAFATFHYYVGAMGVGTTITLWSFLALHLGELDFSRILVYVVLLSVAFVASIAITISVGLWSVDFMQYTVLTGGFVVFGALVHGTATVANIVITGPAAHTTLSVWIGKVASTAIRNGWVGLDRTFLWAWLLLVAYLGIAILIATRLAPYASARPRPVHVALGLVGGAGVVSGLNDLVVVVVG